MSWGTELWDQFDNIADHTQKGLDFCERYQHFIKERCAIEQDYVNKLKKLVKNYSYQSSKKKNDDGLQHNFNKLQRSMSQLQRTRSYKMVSEEDLRFTTVKSFQAMVKELHDMAGQHETIAENFNTQVVKDLQNLTAELKQERKRHLQDGSKQMSALQGQLAQLERAKKQYEKAFKDSEKAQEAYKKADADINLSRAEVEKAKNNSISKQQHCEDCKNEYAAELQKTNQVQDEHYHKMMPEIFQRLQEMDEKRIQRLAAYIRKTAEVEKNVLPIISTCIEGTFQAADAINPAQDSQIVIEKHRSGLSPPTDIPFEDLSCPGSDNHVPSQTPKNSTLRSDAHKGTTSDRSKSHKARKGLFAIFSTSKIGGALPSSRDKPFRQTLNGLGRNDEAKEDFSDRPPAQQQKKLLQKIEELKTQVTKETAERNGLLNLRDAYVRNPAHGDPSSLDKQLEDNAQRLDKLRQDLQKFEGYLAEAEARLTGHSASDDSITHSMSEVSVGSHHQGSAPGTPTATHTNRDHQGNQESDGWSDDETDETPQGAAPPAATDGRGQRGSPDSGVDNVHQAHYAEQDSFDDGLEEFPVIGSCRALYSFDASNEGSIDMFEGETYDILEADQGDGWTRVRKANGEEGFVPTSYLDCKFV